MKMRSQRCRSPSAGASWADFRFRSPGRRSSWPTAVRRSTVGALALSAEQLLKWSPSRLTSPPDASRLALPLHRLRGAVVGSSIFRASNDAMPSSACGLRDVLKPAHVLREVRASLTSGKERIIADVASERHSAAVRMNRACPWAVGLSLLFVANVHPGPERAFLLIVVVLRP